MPAILDKLLRIGEGKILRTLEGISKAVNAIEDDFVAMSDAELQGMTDEFRERLAKGESLDDLMPEAFATVREAARRVLGQRHFDVQIMGGAALHLGNIAEMKTGEGKTLVSTLPAYLNALEGNGVHVVTVNDYLAKFQSEWMGRVHHFLGLTVGVILPEMRPDERRIAYACDITYGTNNELGFDYLRDNMAGSIEECVQRSHNFAIVDEVDSILIDEARTPLIISGPTQDEVKWYGEFATIARGLERDVDYEVDEKKRTISVLEPGITKVEDHLGIENLYESVNTPLISFMHNSIKAKELFHNDKEYVVMEGEVLIVDEHTGRMLAGRRYNDGLHQAIEAKEGVPGPRGVPDPRHDHPAELLPPLREALRHDRYGHDRGVGVRQDLQARRGPDPDQHADGAPRQRRPRLPDRGGQVRRGGRGHPRAAREGPADPGRHRVGREVRAPLPEAEEARRPALGAQRQAARRRGEGRRGRRPQGRGHRRHQHGRPRHRHHARRLGRVPRRPGAAQAAASTRWRSPEDYEAAWPAALEKVKEQVARDHDEVRDLGGLYVVGTERHESRRIDNQLRGRSGRQGDPGESRFYLSLQDELMRLFKSDWVDRVLQVLKIPDDVPIENKRVTNAIANAQGQVESQNFESRKNVLKYDDVMDRQRKVIYSERREVLEGADIEEQVRTFIDDVVIGVVTGATQEFAEEWDLEQLWIDLKQIWPVSLDLKQLEDEHGGAANVDRDELIQELQKDAQAAYDAREAEVGEEVMRELERRVLLSVLDRKWREHLYEMDYLREGIYLRAYSQRDPLVEYQREGFEMFATMMDGIKEEAVGFLFNLEVSTDDEDDDGEEEVEIEEPMRRVIPDIAPSGSDDDVDADDPMVASGPSEQPNEEIESPAAAFVRQPQISAKGLAADQASRRSCPTPPRPRTARPRSRAPR